MIKIIVDSTAYIPEKVVKENDLTVLPLTVHLGEESFEEGFPGTFDKYFEREKQFKDYPKTSQPSAGLITDAFEKVINNNDEAIVLTISFALSGTFNTCQMIKEQVDKNNQISVIDSGATAQNIYCYVLEILKLIKENKTRQQIVERIESLKINSSLSFIPDTLNHLRKGGRIGTVSTIIGNLLKIKPILVFQNGTLSCVKRVLGIQKAMSDLIARLPENPLYLCVLRISNSPFFECLKQKVKEKFPNIKLVDCEEVGPAVGAHVGPAIGIACIY